MSRDFPDWINPWTAAQGKRRFAGTVPLRRMKRLATSLEGDAGAVCAFEASFGLDEERRPVIDLAVEADLVLLCQASLEPYTEHVERRSTLGVVESDGEIGLLPPHYEPVFADNGRIALAILVEDELILGLPQVPRNPALDAVRFTTGPDRHGGAARGSERADRDEEARADSRSGRTSPFAVLKGKVGQPD